VRDEYRLELDRAAERELERLLQRERQRIEDAIDKLSSEPRPHGVLKLQGYADAYRLRVESYRLTYAVFDTEKLIKVLDVLKRDTQTYRKLGR
jgi:mRNA interferase RelE/StbE